MSSMLLYNSAVSGNCYKVRLLAAQLGIPLELQELDVVDRSDRQEVIGHLNPALRVPTLVLDDGRPLAESNAIIDYLAEGTEHLPGDRYERAQVLAWQFFEQYEIEPNLAVARFLKLFGVDAPEAFWRQRFEGGRKGLEALERGLTGRAWLVGERYSVADISLYAYTHVADEGDFDLEPYPQIRAWLQRVAAEPGTSPSTPDLAWKRQWRQGAHRGFGEHPGFNLGDQRVQLGALARREVADATLAVADQHDDAMPFARSQAFKVVPRQQQHLAGHDDLQERHATQARDAADELSRGQSEQRGGADPQVRLHRLPILGLPVEPSGPLPDRFRSRARRCDLRAAANRGRGFWRRLS